MCVCVMCGRNVTVYVYTCIYVLYITAIALRIVLDIRTQAGNPGAAPASLPTLPWVREPDRGPCVRPLELSEHVAESVLRTLRYGARTL